ncbi:MAG: hypothetical protein R2710_16015 [Acidimicrobiales bacterium]
MIGHQIDELGPEGATESLLSGQTIRGLSDAEIATIDVDAVVWPMIPENQFHQGSTVSALVGLLPRPLLMGGSPEAVHAGFAPFLDSFVSMLVEVSILDDDDQAGR